MNDKQQLQKAVSDLKQTRIEIKDRINAAVETARRNRQAEKASQNRRG